jgi:hypothetical protein
MFPFVLLQFHIVPLNGAQWWWIAGLSVFPAVVIEFGKLFRRTFGKAHKANE